MIVEKERVFCLKFIFFNLIINKKEQIFVECVTPKCTKNTEMVV